LHFLQQFIVQHALQPVNMRQFIHEAGQAQGQDISKEVDPYVCVPQPGQPTQSKGQPLACLPR
jgi:hypothetical protein